MKVSKKITFGQKNIFDLVNGDFGHWGPQNKRLSATGQYKIFVILVSSHDGIKTDIEEHQPAFENITNIDVDLIRQPEAPNWPTVGGLRGVW